MLKVGTGIKKCEESDYDYEQIFGDNCSEDKTLVKLKEISSKDKNVKVISYSRNFGAFQSLYNGAISATGDAIICISAILFAQPGNISMGGLLDS